MRWIRSFPDTIPEGRSYVVDPMERLILHDYDYTPLGAIDEDVCLIEWDMALSREHRATFERIANEQRSRVLVAPYRLYGFVEGPCWAHRIVTRPLVESTIHERWVMTGEPFCDYFAFGLIYLPRDLVRAFLAAPAPERGCPPDVPLGHYADVRMHDQTFSVWHMWRSGYRTDRARIAWNVQPIHLHY